MPYFDKKMVKYVKNFENTKICFFLKMAKICKNIFFMFLYINPSPTYYIDNNRWRE